MKSGRWGGAESAVAPAYEVRVKAPTLILPARVQRPAPRVSSREIGVYVPPEALFPDLESTEATMVALLGTLSRDAKCLGQKIFYILFPRLPARLL